MLAIGIKPRSSKGGGNKKRVLVPGLDRLLDINQMELLMAAPSGRRICSCNDRNCCPHGWEDTLRNPKVHYLYQRHKQVQALSRIPEVRRVQHFLDHEMADTNRFSGKAARIRTSDEGLREVLFMSSERLDRMSRVLEELRTTIGDAPRSAAPRSRSRNRACVARKR